MNLKTLQHIAQHFEPLDAGIVADLVELTKKFPYFAWPYAILARHYHEKQDFRTEAFMHQAAMRIHDRTWLFQFVHGTTTKQLGASAINQDNSDSAQNPTPTIQNTTSEYTETTKIEELETKVAPVVEPTQEESPTSNKGNQNHTLVNENVTKPADIEGTTRELTSAPETRVSKDEQSKKSFVIPKPEIKSIPIKPKPTVSFYDIEKIYGNTDTTKNETNIQGNASLDFYTWLNKSAGNETNPEHPQANEGNKQHQLIEKFLVNKPSITKPKQEFFRAETAYKKGEKMSNVLITETLASIYLKQDNPQKAIWAYEQLQLKFPEKKTYFANLIEQIKKEHLKS